jgi:hypothetical protein
VRSAKQINHLNINSVLNTFRLSLLTINHFLRFSKSEFTAVSRSEIKSPQAVRLMSSANNRGFVLYRHWGKSLYNRNVFSFERACHTNGGAIIRASAFHLWVRGFDSRYGLMWKESVNALPKVVQGFPGALVSSHRKSWQGGLGQTQLRK